MALSPRRTADRFRTALKQRFGFDIQDVEILTLLYQAMIDEIKEEMEARNVISPSDGYTVEIPSSSSTVKYDVDGTSLTGEIKKGNFR
jgi:hypothetical protein